MVTNGKIPVTQLAKVDDTHYAAPGCADAFHRWSDHMQTHYGVALTVGNAADSCYRSYAWQVYRYNLHRSNPSRYPVAAYPGTSNHGLGLAVDIGNYYRFKHPLLVATGRQFGFVFDTSTEAWHVKYVGAANYHSAVKVTAVLVTETEDDMDLIYNRTTKQYGVFSPAKGILVKTATQGVEYARLLKELRDLPDASLAQVRKEVTDQHWKMLATDYGISG